MIPKIITLDLPYNIEIRIPIQAFDHTPPAEIEKEALEKLQVATKDIEAIIDKALLSCVGEDPAREPNITKGE